MRLLTRNITGEIHLTKDLLDHEIPRYAILSHTWGDEEVLLQDVKDGTDKKKHGYEKIKFCANQAWEHDLQFFWVDTCCIDKANSVELQEAINSMFRWYQEAARCYVYLADVSVPTSDAAVDKSTWAPSFQKTRWFSRGWTLQELIAPVSVEFFSKEGVLLGTKNSLADDIHHITGLPLSVLRGSSPLSSFSICERLAWAEKRETTRKEDKAYSLLGIFGIHMPLIYGEGESNAFRRLRTEVEQTTRSEVHVEKRRFEEAEGDWSKDLQDGRRDDYETVRLSKRPKHGVSHSAGGSSAAPPGNNDSIDDSVKDRLIGQLFFSKIDERLTNLTAAQGRTCRWFLSKPEYVTWSRTAGLLEDSGFLWIKGHPGTGKSTLMKLLFEETKLRTRHDPLQITLSFFFLARGTLEERSTTGLYRSILHQLFEKAADLKDSLGWMTADGARGILENGWHDQALKQTLKHAVSELGSRSLTFFVDALDECDQSQVAGMVSFFEELCDHAIDKGVKLRICFSSRHYPTVVIERGVEIVLEDETGHTDDIQQYIKSKLRLGKTKHADSLRSEILEKSSGIFLWVVLVLDILNAEYLNRSVSIKAMRDRLKEMPPGLHELFEMILARDAKNLNQLDVCLKWILFATRPLKPQEFYFAVQLALDMESSTYWDQEDVELDQMKMFVRTSTKGLAEVTRNRASDVQFIHESVRDFLLGRYSGQRSGQPSENFEGESHNMLRDCCLAQLNAPVDQYVDIPDPIPQGPEWVKLREDLSLKFPFLAYSIFSVLRHANVAQYHGMEQMKFLSDFPLTLWASFNNALEKHVIRRYREVDLLAEINLLYILAEHNLADLIRIHPEVYRSLCFVISGERYGPPFFAALATQSNEAIEELVEACLCLEPQGSLLRDLGEEYCRSAEKSAVINRSFTFSPRTGVLQYILGHDQEGLLALLIAAGHGDARCQDGRDPLSHAAERGWKTLVVSLLGNYETDIEGKGNDGRTALSWAAVGGQEAIVQLLLDNGAYIESRNKNGRTPLSWAAFKGREAIVKLLLDNNADIDSKDENDRTPLSWAMESGHESTVRLLLDRGASIMSQDGRGKTPLMYAAIAGREGAARLLLEKGECNVNAKGSNGKTALTAAAQRGHDAILELLIKTTAADVDIKDRKGRTPLSYAAGNGHTGAIRLLLGTSRVEVDGKDEGCRTPLSYAAETGQVAAVQLLVETGAVDVNAKDSSGRSPLGWASEEGHPAVMQVLLDNEANPNVRDSEGHTPLWHVVETRFKAALQGYQAQLMLLEQMNKKRLMRARLGQRMALQEQQQQPQDGLSTEVVPSEEQPLEESYLRGNLPAEDEMMARLLLERGAHVGQSDGYYLLSYAAEKGIEDIARLVLATGQVDINVKDENGRTPLSRATKNNHPAVVRLLIDAGATISGSGSGIF